MNHHQCEFCFLLLKTDSNSTIPIFFNASRRKTKLKVILIPKFVSKLLPWLWLCTGPPTALAGHHTQLASRPCLPQGSAITERKKALNSKPVRLRQLLANFHHIHSQSLLWYCLNDFVFGSCWLRDHWCQTKSWLLTNRKQGNDTNVLYQFRKQLWTNCHVLLLLTIRHQLWLSYRLNKRSRMTMDDNRVFVTVDSTEKGLV